SPKWSPSPPCPPRQAGPFHFERAGIEYFHSATPSGYSSTRWTQIGSDRQRRRVNRKACHQVYPPQEHLAKTQGCSDLSKSQPGEGAREVEKAIGKRLKQLSGLRANGYSTLSSSLQELNRVHSRLVKFLE